MRTNEWCEYREGVTVADGGQDGQDEQGTGAWDGKKKRQKQKHKKKDMNSGESSTLVHTGLPERTRLPDLSIPANTRITIKFRSRDLTGGADPVNPSAPREEAGYYWGYSVRRCASLSDVFTECPFEGGYDVSFGTSERGDALSDVLRQQDVPKFEHLIIVFGGVAGLEAAVKVDKELEARGVKPEEAKRVFDYWVNVLPGQGSRTIRTEEAVWLGLMGFRELVQRNSSL
jgi:predicted SPOUT superfamily RNA methylase MTH1